MKNLIFLLLGLFGTSTSQESYQDISGTTKFTGDVYKELTKTNSGSFMVCPLSVDVLLALIHGGARGKTAQELSTVLHLPESQEAIVQIFSQLSSKLKSTDEYDLNSANKIFLKQNFQVNYDIKKRAVDFFNAEIENIDFRQSEKAEFDINNWVSDKTNGKIKNLVSADDFNDDDITAILINAVYFRGTWVKEFDPYGTYRDIFYRNHENLVSVDMMQMADEFNRFDSAELDAKFLEMPYAGQDVTMTFVLPNDPEGLSVLEDRIDEVLETRNDEFGNARIILPKFKIETTIQLRPVLEALGMRVPFSSSADFSDFGANSEPLSISRVIQKSFIEVEEKGTEAAAGTSGFIVPLSGDYEPPPQMEFIANHPFLYFIKVQGTVLFIGRYSEP